MNVGILFSDFGPYHVARMEALAVALSEQGSRLYAFQFSATSDTYGWKPVFPTGIEVITLTQKPPVSTVDAFQIALTLRRALQERNIDLMFLPSYSPLPNLLCLVAAKSINCRTILMNESWNGTERAGFMGRLAKQVIVRSFDAALVGGTPQKEYACAYGQDRERVFLGYDVVDIDYYTQESKRWKNRSNQDTTILNLPDRYFLNLGRFVPKKNIGLLIRAYAQLTQPKGSTPVALVLVGEGSEENAIRQLAADHHLPVRNGTDVVTESAQGLEVVFYPFQQVDKTPLFFSRCEAFILPSLYEEWGLVINEAMACGVAVIVSENVGCARDLVQEGHNGFQFNPTDSHQLADLLQRFIDDPTLANRLGQNGSALIQEWGPDRFVDGALKAIQATSPNLLVKAKQLPTHV